MLSAAEVWIPPPALSQNLQPHIPIRENRFQMDP